MHKIKYTGLKHKYQKSDFRILKLTGYSEVVGQESIILKIGKIKHQEYFSKLGTNGGNKMEILKKMPAE